MVKKLTRTGNSVALVLDKELLEATGLHAGSTVDAGSLAVGMPAPVKAGSTLVLALHVKPSPSAVPVLSDTRGNFFR